MKTRLSALMLLLCALPLAHADAEVKLTGFTAPYVNREKSGYQYVSFGTYPYEKDGTEAPVLWRVLGPGVPGDDDVIDAANAPDKKWKKVANTDDMSGDNADMVCLMTEYIVDMVQYNDVKDTEEGGGLDYENSMMYATLNSEVLNRMFTPEQQAVLVEMPERGKLALPTRKGELFRTDYGFPAEDFTVSKTRNTIGTPYAYSQGLRHVEGHSWYFTADWRRYGQRWIVGDNGHISVSGVNRRGGVRLVCYVHQKDLDSAGGTGTFRDPIVLTVAK